MEPLGTGTRDRGLGGEAPGSGQAAVTTVWVNGQRFFFHFWKNFEAKWVGKDSVQRGNWEFENSRREVLRLI